MGKVIKLPVKRAGKKAKRSKKGKLYQFPIANKETDRERENREWEARSKLWRRAHTLEKIFTHTQSFLAELMEEVKRLEGPTPPAA